MRRATSSVASRALAASPMTRNPVPRSESLIQPRTIASSSTTRTVVSGDASMPQLEVDEVEEAVDELRLELRPAAADELAHRHVDRESLAVGAVVRHRVEGVGE